MKSQQKQSSSQLPLCLVAVMAVILLGPTHLAVPASAFSAKNAERNGGSVKSSPVCADGDLPLFLGLCLLSTDRGVQK